MDSNRVHRHTNNSHTRSSDTQTGQTSALTSGRSLRVRCAGLALALGAAGLLAPLAPSAGSLALADETATTTATPVATTSAPSTATSAEAVGGSAAGNSWNSTLLSLAAASSKSTVLTATGTPATWPDYSNPDEGFVQLGIAGAFDRAAAQALLTRVNEIRAEAAAQGITVDGVPVSGTPLVWSDALEYIAQCRAPETAIFFSHSRLAGGILDDFYTEGLTGADIAYGSEIIAADTDAAQALELFYAEKGSQTAFLSTDDATGHYVDLISDKYTTIGLGVFNYGSRTYLTGILGSGSAASSTLLRDGAGIQMVTLGAEGTEALQVGVTASSGALADGAVTYGSNQQSLDSLSATVTYLSQDGMNTPTDLTSVVDLTWESTDPAVVSVADSGERAAGTVTVSTGSAGTASLVLKSGTETLYTVHVTVAAEEAEVPTAQSVELTTESGVEPTWPGTVEVYYSDGRSETVPVVWETGSLTEASWTNTDGSNGLLEVSGLATLANGTQVPATLNVTVLQAPAAPAPVSASVAEGTTTTAGTEPVLPASATVVWDNGTQTTEVVAWDPVEPSSYAAAGSFNATGTVTVDETTLPVSTTVTVQANSIASVDTPDPVTVANNTAPSLPGTVTAHMSDGSVREVPVVWDDVDPASYSGFEANVFTVHGTVDGFDAGVDITVNVAAATPLAATVEEGSTTTAGTRPTLPTNATIEWDNGRTSTTDVVWDTIPESSYAQAGSFEATGSVTVAGTVLQVRTTVTVEAVGISSVESPEAVSTPSGTAPGLPATVRAQLSDGNTADVAVNWADINADLYHTRGASSFTVHGSIEGYPAGVDITVNVEAAVATAAEVADSVSTTEGTAPVLPEAATVSWSNGDNTEEAVSWSPVEASSYASPGSFVVHGTVSAGGAQLDVSTTVTVEAAPEATIDSEVEPAAISTASGAAPVLPARLTVQMSDGTTQEVDVVWDEIATSSYSSRGASSFAVHGSIEGYEPGVDITINVEAATAIEATVADSVRTTAGTAPELPTLATVSWSNGETSQEAVSWDAIAANSYESEGTFEANGKVTLGETVLPVRATVTVEAAPDSPATDTDNDSIASVDAVNVTTNAGYAPALPAKVTARSANGAARQLSVSWDAVDPASYSVIAGGNFTVHGSIEGYEPGVDAQVSVNAASLVSVHTASVTTQAGVAPQLPESVQVDWTGGLSSTENVSWDEVNPDSYAAAGRVFTVTGSFTNPATGAAERVTCRVSVTDATATRVASVSVSTAAGVAPVLPGTVDVTYDNGETRKASVSWASIDPSQYAQAGNSFTVTGTVYTGVPETMQATAQVRVTSAVATSVITPGAVRTSLGTAPSLPTSVTVQMSDGSTQQMPISWNAVNASLYSNAGTFSVNGTVDGTSLSTSVQVIVSALDIREIQNSFDITTALNTEPELPATVEATLSDGSKRSIPVSWESYDKSNLAVNGRTFDIKGSAQGHVVLAHITVGNQIARTGDQTSLLPVYVLAGAGALVLAGAGIALALRTRRQKTRS